MEKTDFHFTFDGFFYKLLPNNNGQAAELWNQVADVYPGGAIPRSAWAGLRAQIVAAGYSVRKAPSRRNDEISDDALLAALGA